MRRLPLGSVVALVVIVGATALRLWDLGRRSLWYDEAWAALGCLDGPLDIAHVRATPYLFAGLVRGAVDLLGRNELAVRLPAAVFSVASVVLGYVVGRRALGRLGGITMALLLGWLPIPVAYGKEMKHYAMAKGETIIQVHGIGPFEITYINAADDPRNKDK